jgi:NACalpha-BTF3-like transcription factor
MSIPECDVELVAQRCGVGRDPARRALRREAGDLAAAIARIENDDISTHEGETANTHRASTDVPEADVDLVAQRADVSPAKAHEVLQKKNGDLADAVAALTQEQSSSQYSTARQATEQSTDESTSVSRSTAPDTDESPTTVYVPESTTSEESSQTALDHCPQCGTAIERPDIADFCSNCGTGLE